MQHPKHDYGNETYFARCRANALRSKLAGERMLAALDRVIALVRKGGFNPDQPRVPAGSPEGG